MKRIAIILVLMLFAIPCIASEEEAKQTTDDNIAAVSVQKQPLNENSKQKITKNIACIIIQVNGKVKDSADEK